MPVTTESLLGLAVLVFVAVIAGRFCLRMWRQRRSRDVDQWWRPPELQGARVACSETTFRTLRPFPLVARVDRGFHVADGIALVELKTRARHVVYQSDVIELSAQKATIEGAGAGRVSSLAFVVTADRRTGRRRTHRVMLWGQAALARLEVRREGILKRDLEPQPPESITPCRTCAYRSACQDRFHW